MSNRIYIEGIGEVIVFENDANNNCEPGRSTEDSTSSLQGTTKSSIIEESNDFAHWTVNATKNLIDLYETYRNKVGSCGIKNFKKLWEILSSEMKKTFNMHASPSQCENRWRVLERNYKKFIDNNSKTGRSRKYFEYEEEMNKIFGKKKNVHPEILLSSDTRVNFSSVADENILAKKGMSSGKENCIPNDEQQTDVNVITEDLASTSTPAIEKKKDLPAYSRSTIKTSRKKRSCRNDILEVIRKDRLEYQKERLKIENERLEIEKEKLKEKKRRNDLVAERNRLITIHLENNIPLPQHV